jgi:hypothetical protein
MLAGRVFCIAERDAVIQAARHGAIAEDAAASHRSRPT